MTRKSNTMWAVGVLNEKLSEAVQRIAFTFGYFWPFSPHDEKTPKYLRHKYLCFNSTNKLISWCDDTECIKKEGVPIYSSIESVVNLFKDPNYYSVVEIPLDVSSSRVDLIKNSKNSNKEFEELLFDIEKILTNMLKESESKNL